MSATVILAACMLISSTIGFYQNLKIRSLEKRLVKKEQEVVGWALSATSYFLEKKDLDRQLQSYRPPQRDNKGRFKPIEKKAQT